MNPNIPPNRQGARPWGGLVPAGLEPHSQDDVPVAEGPPPVVPEVPLQDRVAGRVDDIHGVLEIVREHLERVSLLPPELLAFQFDGNKPGTLEQRDDHTQMALSYGIYNPTEVPIYIGFGGVASAAAGFPVPAPGWVVVPVLVGSVLLAADAEALGKEQATIWRLRFPSVQAFDLGKL